MKKKFFSIFLFVCILLCSVVPTVASDTNTNSENYEQKMELMPAITNDCVPTIYYTSIGFSGQTYTYQETNGLVVLSEGIFTKSGGVSYYSNAFLSNLYSMDDCVQSLSDGQLRVWLFIRALLPAVDIASNFIELPEVIDALSLAVELADVDLGDRFLATALMMTDWYNAEVNARQNYSQY